MRSVAPSKCAQPTAPKTCSRYSDTRCLPKGCIATSLPLVSGRSGDWWGLGNPNTTECPHQQWTDGSWPGIPEYTEANNKYSSCVSTATIDCAMAATAILGPGDGSFTFGARGDGSRFLTLWEEVLDWTASRTCRAP